MMSLHPRTYWLAASPRNALCQMWLCAETKPGMTIFPLRVILRGRLERPAGGAPRADALNAPVIVHGDVADERRLLARLHCDEQGLLDQELFGGAAPVASNSSNNSGNRDDSECALHFFGPRNFSPSIWKIEVR